MTTDPQILMFGYRQKITSLQIEVGQAAAYTFGGRHLDLHALIRNLPRLKDLELYHLKDGRPYRNLDVTIKWRYPQELFDALEYVNPNADGNKGDKTSICELRSWRWSKRLAGDRWPINTLREVHLKKPFVGLSKISFVNYQVDPPKKDKEDPQHEVDLAKSLEVLKNLKHLVFEASSLVNAKLLPLLPTNLHHLEFINCWEITSDLFAEFLLAHGRQLRTLTLNHNQALNLSFLPILAEACPNLEEFKVDLSYFDAHVSYHNREPDYEVLMRLEEVPTWPSTLQTIELINLRKWDKQASEMFFQSLLDSAGGLPDLRRLTLQTSIDIPWRDRADFRNQWIGSLVRVFKRVLIPPIAIVKASDLTPKLLAQKGNSQQSKQIPDVSTSITSLNSVTSLPETPARRSTRSHPQKSYVESPVTSEDEDGPEPEPEDNEGEDSSHPSGPSDREVARKGRISRELASLKLREGVFDWPSSTAHSPQNSSQYDTDVEAKTKTKGKGKEIIQGMCSVVNIRIDNLRPAENQLTEQDFLDSEPEDDGDWDENADDGFEDAVAW